MGLGMVVLVLLLYALSVARLTRLVNADTITDPVRLYVARRARDTGDRSDAERARWATLSYFLSCPWCVGFWLALALAYVPTRLVGWPAWALVPVALAASHLTGVFAFAADTEDIAIADADDGQ